MPKLLVIVLFTIIPFTKVIEQVNTGVPVIINIETILTATLMS